MIADNMIGHRAAAGIQTKDQLAHLLRHRHQEHLRNGGKLRSGATARECPDHQRLFRTRRQAFGFGFAPSGAARLLSLFFGLPSGTCELRQPRRRPSLVLRQTLLRNKLYTLEFA